MFAYCCIKKGGNMIRKTWSVRYDASLNDYISIKNIMVLLNCSQPSAIKVRTKAKNYCQENGIGYPGKMVPVDAVFAVTGKGRDYYYDMMLAEAKSLNWKENDDVSAKTH